MVVCGLIIECLLWVNAALALVLSGATAAFGWRRRLGLPVRFGTMTRVRLWCALISVEAVAFVMLAVAWTDGGKFASWTFGQLLLLRTLVAVLYVVQFRWFFLGVIHPLYVVEACKRSQQCASYLLSCSVILAVVAILSGGTGFALLLARGIGDILA